MWFFDTYEGPDNFSGPVNVVRTVSKGLHESHGHAHEHVVLQNGRASAMLDYCDESRNLTIRSLKAKTDPKSTRVMEGITLHSHPKFGRAVVSAVITEVRRRGAETVSIFPNLVATTLFHRLGGLTVSAETFCEKFFTEAKAYEKDALKRTLRHQGPDESNLMPKDLLFRAQTSLIERGHQVERWKSSHFDQIFEGLCERCGGRVYAFKYERKSSVNPSGRPFSGELVESLCASSKLKFKPLES